MQNPAHQSRRMVPVVAGFEAALAVVAIGLGWAIDLDPLATLRWEPAALAWGVLAALPLFALMWLMVRLPIESCRQILRFVRSFLVDTFAGATLADFALVSLLAGIGEEALFRGLLQPLFADMANAPLTGLAIASLLFGLAHSVSKTYALMATLIGLYLGGLWLATGNLLTPITTHAVYDFLALWYLSRRIGRSPK